jgi:hypothetical protein
MKSIQVNTIITGIRSKVDGSLGLSMVTPELTPEEKAEFMRLQGTNLITVLTPLDMKDAPKYKVDKELEQKTPSNRLRSVLYVLYEQDGARGEFDEFYKSHMEGFIDSVKEQLA